MLATTHYKHFNTQSGANDVRQPIAICYLSQSGDLKPG